MGIRLQHVLMRQPQHHLILVLLACAALTLLIASPVKAQDARGAPCMTSVVLRDCPDRQAAPFQTQAERDEAAQRQQMQDQFASTEQQRARRAAQAENDLDTITVYGRQQAPSTPALVEFGQTVAKSGPKDCRNAYSTTGPKGDFGVFDLMHDTFAGRPCSWK